MTDTVNKVIIPSSRPYYTPAKTTIRFDTSTEVYGTRIAANAEQSIPKFLIRFTANGVPRTTVTFKWPGHFS